MSTYTQNITASLGFFALGDLDASGFPNIFSPVVHVIKKKTLLSISSFIQKSCK